MPGDIYTAEMGEPPFPDEGPTARNPMMTPADMMRAMKIGSPADLPKGYVHRKEPDEGPARGKEVGVRKASAKTEAYQRKFAKGGYTTAADGCVSKGKTKGRFV